MHRTSKTGGIITSSDDGIPRELDDAVDLT
jgi:hypothetical protein